MSAQEDIEKFLRALSRVPETKLTLLDLARKCVDDDGKLDYSKVRNNQAEINLAIAQAQIYGATTAQAVVALRSIRSRKEE
ncbi:MAG: hypothetical protein PHF31_06920 [Methylobacter sp.]|jgi:hypothetical protein|nr:hypothetical protein [Methylobacter sp.]